MGRFPARANFDKQGKPLLSWRVHILPYLEENPLYQQFHLDEPWDSEHNRKLIPMMPAFYRNPSGTWRSPAWQTTWRFAARAWRSTASRDENRGFQGRNVPTRS